MIDDKKLKQLLMEFSRPRPEFNGKSYITMRREWFDKPKEKIRPLIENPEAINKLTIEEAEKIYKEATVGGPRLYPRTFIENGIEKIQKSFKYLLFGKEPLEERFYNFVENPKSEYRLNGVGRAFASTLLLILDKKNYGIWNSATDGGLEILNLLPPKDKKNVGELYVEIVKVLKNLAKQCGFEDLSVVDEFLQLIFHGTLKVPEREIEVTPSKEVETSERPEEKRVHLQMQWMLIKIGKWEGYDVWVAINDFNKEYNGEKFTSLCLSDLPQFASPTILKIARMIDVIWFKKGTTRPVRFFEVEHTGTIYPGLLRINDINIDYPIPKATIVASENKRRLFESQVTRRTFVESGLSEICDFMDYKEVKDWFDSAQKIQKIKKQ